MADPHWAEIDAAFAEAADLPPDAQAVFLARLPDDAVRQRVAALLAHHTPDAPLLETAVGHVADQWLAAEAPQQRPTLLGGRIGPYEVTGVAGEGGMGAVYRARRADGQFEQEVAIKLVRLGLETPAALDRFRQERQILARLTHPAIARLLDGGTLTDEAGRDVPYLVMEYVDGQPITDYCSAQGLSIRDRVSLFRIVCDALQHAHQQLVVHRDLKPSNIMVTRDGQPKLLDFGIAKLLTETASNQRALTVTGLGPLTPAYASPEQIKGEPVTAAIDVYALGAVLYELLTGQRAHQFETQSPAEISRVICDTETTRPSLAVTRTAPGATKLRRQLEGDLDTILLKALRKEPSRRYASVEQFSEDLRRHLDGLPVLARSDTVTYRAGKFVRRNRLALAAASLVSASLVAGTVVSLWQARRAERRFDQVRKLANSLIYDVHDAIRDSGSTKARQTVVATALEYLSGLEREASGDPGLTRDLAAAYLRIGDVQGGVLESNLGDAKGALASYRKARSLFERSKTATEKARQVAGVNVKIGDALSYHGDLTGALQAYSSARSIMEPITAGADTPPADLLQLASVFQAMARVQGLQRVMADALESSERVLALRQSVAARDPANKAWRDSLAGAEAEVSMSLQRMAKPREALPHARQALAMRERQAADQPNNVGAQRSLILAYSHVADVLGNPTMPSLGDTAGAIELYRKMTVVAERLVASDASDRRAKLDLANCLLRLGSALLATTGADEGIVDLEQSATLMRELIAAEPKNNRVRLTLAAVYVRLGDALSAQGRFVPAIEQYQLAISTSEQVIASDPAEASITLPLATAHTGKGLASANSGRREAALRDGSRGMEVLEQARLTQPGNTRTLTNAAAGYAAMGRIYTTLGTAGDRLQGCSWFQKSADAYLQVKSSGSLDVKGAADLDAVTRQLANCR